ncbi:MAG: hypothetical protein ACJAUN_001507 [Alcanivorax sp.]|jgi:hypothetical protein
MPFTPPLPCVVDAVSKGGNIKNQPLTALMTLTAYQPAISPGLPGLQ